MVGSVLGALDGVTDILADVLPPVLPRPVVSIAVKGGLVLVVLGFAKSLLSVRSYTLDPCIAGLSV